MSSEGSNKAVLIVPYYGKWPDYFNIYLESLAHNQHILDLLLVTDLAIPDHIKQRPPNLIVHHQSLEDLKKKADKKLGLNTGLSNPYKLCDFKPLYGYLFDDLIDRYEYWGFGDIDLIYGNLEKFLEGKLSKYDILHFRKKWISGSFTLLKNRKQIRELFFHSTDIKSIFENPAYLGFDETSLNWKEIRTLPLKDINFAFDNFTSICYRHQPSLHIYSDNLIAESIPGGQFIRYVGQNIKDSFGQEYMIYHMVSEKRNWFFRSKLDSPESYFITPFGFFDEDTFEKKLWYKVQILVNFILQIPVLIKKILLKIKSRHAI